MSYTVENYMIDKLWHVFTFTVNPNKFSELKKFEAIFFENTVGKYILLKQFIK